MCGCAPISFLGIDKRDQPGHPQSYSAHLSAILPIRCGCGRRSCRSAANRRATPTRSLWTVATSACSSLAISPGWFSEKTTSGLGWIAIGLVIFAQWDPIRASLGSFLFGGLRRLILDLQGPQRLLFFANPFFYQPHLGFFLQMVPYAFTIVVLVIGSREALRKRLGTPAALGLPYIRGERGA